MLARAYADSRVFDRELFTAIARAAEARSMALREARHVSICAWAIASSGIVAPASFRTLTVAIAARAHELRPRELSMTAWALATSRMHEPLALSALAAAAVRAHGSFSGRELAGLLWAFARLNLAQVSGGQEGERQEHTRQAQRPFGEERSGQESGTELGQVQNGPDPASGPSAERREAAAVAARGAAASWGGVRHLFAQLALGGEAQAPAMRAGELCMSLWALAIADQLGSSSGTRPFADAAWSRLCAQPSAALRTSELIMIGQFLLTDRCGGKAHGYGARAPTPLLAAVEAAAAQLAPEISDEHRALSHALSAAGWAHVQEQPLEGGLIIVDMARPDERIALEFDGREAHTLCNPQNGELVESGNSEWKARTLRRLGWRLVSVQSHEWAAARRSDSAMREFIERTLAALR
jgi:hypothetical protein